mmetsp:Transcript_64987/g.136151  ORF Transcript_64987/g.136151 Transcript_64987/m.136151 type:complete len:140 (+) Transcript_64987:182-601(+)
MTARAMQEWLVDEGYPTDRDGDFGRASANVVSSLSKYTFASMGVGKVALSGEQSLMLSNMATASKFGWSMGANTAKLLVKASAVMAVFGVAFDALTLGKNIDGLARGSKHEMSDELSKARRSLWEQYVANLELMKEICE